MNNVNNEGGLDISSNLNFTKDGNFYVYGDFDDTISTNIIPELLKAIQTQKDMKQGIIRFFIDSRGGYVHVLANLLAFIEKAKKLGIRVETYALSYAYSCGSLLACSGTKGHRYISHLSEHCCHLGTAYPGSVINDVELERNAARAKNHFNTVRNLYKKYAKVKNLDQSIKFDNWFIRGEDIIKNGLADKFID